MQAGKRWEMRSQRLERDRNSSTSGRRWRLEGVSKGDWSLYRLLDAHLHRFLLLPSVVDMPRFSERRLNFWNFVFVEGWAVLYRFSVIRQAHISSWGLRLLYLFSSYLIIRTGQICEVDRSMDIRAFLTPYVWKPMLIGRFVCTHL